MKRKGRRASDTPYWWIGARTVDVAALPPFATPPRNALLEIATGGAVLVWNFGRDFETDADLLMFVHLTDAEAERVVTANSEAMLEPVRSTLKDNRAMIIVDLGSSSRGSEFEISRGASEEEFLESAFEVAERAQQSAFPQTEAVHDLIDRVESVPRRRRRLRAAVHAHA